MPSPLNGPGNALTRRGEAGGDRLLEGFFVAFWSLDGQILYSPDARLIGKRFPVDEGLARSARGEVTAELTDAELADVLFNSVAWSYLHLRARHGWAAAKTRRLLFGTLLEGVLR